MLWCKAKHIELNFTCLQQDKTKNEQKLLYILPIPTVGLRVSCDQTGIFKYRGSGDAAPI